MSRRRCVDCRWSSAAETNTDVVLECRRHPPVVVPHGGNLTVLWPHVNHDDWCGEWATNDDQGQG